MPRIHNVAGAKKDREKFQYLYKLLQATAPKFRGFAGMEEDCEKLRKEFAMVAISAWLRTLRLSLPNDNFQLTKYLLPPNNGAVIMLAALTHFQMTEKMVCNLLLKFKQKLFENTSNADLPFNLVILKNGRKYYLRNIKPR